MTGSTSRLHRLVIASALVCVTALSVMACGNGNAQDQKAQPTASGSPGSSSGLPGPSDPATPTGASTTPSSSSYPKTARLYAEYLLAAWRQHQVDWLGELTTPEVQSQIIGIPGPPEQTWTFRRCDGAAGSSYCGFVNVNGDIVVLQVSNPLLTKAHAIVGVTFTPTIFPTDGVDYAKAFVAAWQDGNLARMKALAVPDALTYIATRTAPVSPTYAAASGGAGLLQVTVAEAGFHLVLDVGSTLLGTPHAVVGANP